MVLAGNFYFSYCSQPQTNNIVPQKGSEGIHSSRHVKVAPGLNQNFLDEYAWMGNWGHWGQSMAKPHI